MKIYRNSYRDTGHEHKGYSYHTSKREAERQASKPEEGVETETEVIEVPLTKAGVLAALRRCGGHADNG
jgi:hypothetical protein